MQTALKPITGTHKRVQGQYLHDSPTQPRTTYPEAYIAELADSIRANGDILQAIMARKRMSNALRPLSTWSLEDDGYEIIVGHCRKRGGMKAELPDLPIFEVEMTDQQVQLAQLTENLNREDLTFIEEAENLARLRRVFKYEIDTLVQLTGKSRTYVYNQLKLADASQAVKQACIDGKLQHELATLIARIPPHKLQDSALKHTLEIARANDGHSFRKSRRELLDKFSLYLKDALWSLDDTELVAAAGSCTACPKRSGATPELYGDVLEKADYYSCTKSGKDVCMDPECFALKKKTQLANDAHELEQQGKTLVTGNAAKQALTAHGDVKGSYVALKDVRGILKGIKGDDRPKTVLIQDQRSGKTIEAVKKSDLAGAGVDMPDKVDNSYAAQNKREQAENAKWEAKAGIEREFRILLRNRIREKLQTSARSMLELRLVAKKLVSGLDWGGTRAMAELYNANENARSLHVLVDQMTADQIGTFMVECAYAADLNIHTHSFRHGNDKAQVLREVANHHGLDVKALRVKFDDSRGLPTPQPAAQAPKGGKAKAVKKPPAGAAAVVPEVCDRTLPLPLDEPAFGGQEVTDEPAAPAVATTEADAKILWPFKEGGPPAQIASNDAGDAGGCAGQVEATADEGADA